MALSTGLKIGLGIAGAAAVIGVVAAVRDKPAKKKKKTNGKTTVSCPPGQTHAGGFYPDGSPICRPDDTTPRPKGPGTLAPQHDTPLPIPHPLPGSS